MMRVITTLLTLLAALALAVACDGGGGGGTQPSILSVTIAPRPATLQAGASAQLSASVQGTGAYRTEVAWASSDAAVASVSGAGLLTAHGAGQATITAASIQDSSKQDALTLSVTQSQPGIEAVVIGSKPETLEPGAVVQLSATVQGQNNPPQGVRWSSSNTGVATVSASGELRAVAAGSSTITAQSDADPSKADSFTVRVGSGTDPPADYNAYNATLPPWNTFSPTQPNRDEATGSARVEEALVGGAAYQCRVTPYTLTATPERIVTLDPDVDAFWVGSLLQGKGYLGGIGSLRELPVRQRAPLVLYTDLLGPNISRTVETPNPASVQQAISDLILELQASGTPLASDIAFTERRSHSVEESSLRMGVSAKFLKARVKSSLEQSRKKDETTLMVQFYQKLFTITMVRPQTPADFFSAGFTQDVLDAQIRLGNLGPDNIPVYVSSITYGRILHYSFTSKATETEIRATLNASYQALQNGVSVNLDAAQRKLLQEAEIKLVAIGGEQDNALAAIRAGDYRAYFDRNAPLSSATPISYQIRNVGDGSTALLSDTTTYNAEVCGPKWETRRFEEPVECTTGSRDHKGRKSCTTPIVTRTLPANEYFIVATFKAVKFKENGDQHYCSLELTNKQQLDGREVAQSLRGFGHAQSSSCWGCRGWVGCRFEGEIQRLTPVP